MDNKDNRFQKKGLDILEELAREAQDMSMGYSTTNSRAQHWSTAEGDVCLNMWTDDGVMDFVNWYLDFCDINAHYQLENRTILEVYKQQKIAGNKVRAHAEKMSEIIYARDSYMETELTTMIEEYLRDNREDIIRDLEFLKQ